MPIISIPDVNSRRLGKAIVFGVVLSLFCGIICKSGFAQALVPDAPQPATETSFVASTSSSASLSLAAAPREHRFWDRQNLALFTATAAVNLADFSVTRSNLQSGGRELNPIVRLFGRSSAGLAVNFAGETVGVTGLSYLLHKTGHHRLERVAPTLDIGLSVSAVIYGLTHR